MGRIKKYIDVWKYKYWTLFDIGARNTYIIQQVAETLPTFDLPKLNPVLLGGKVHNVTKCSHGL